jgi:rubrerythrin
MHISPQSLRQLVGELDQAHHDTLDLIPAQFDADLSTVNQYATSVSRRRLISAAAVGAGTLTLGSLRTPLTRWLPQGWGVGAASAQQQSTTTTTAPAAAPLTDKDIAVFARRLEWSAVAAYDLVTRGALATKITTPAVRDAALTFAQHHRDHAVAFSDLVGLGDDRNATAAPLSNVALTTDIAGQLQAAITEADVLKIAFELENAAAGTYLIALSAATTATLSSQSASILPIEAGHATVLGQVLGLNTTKLESMLPDFDKVDAGISPTGKFALAVGDPDLARAKDVN